MMATLKILLICSATANAATDFLGANLPQPNYRELPHLDLPTPHNFLKMLLNATEREITDIVSHFTFDEVLDEDITFLLYQEDGSIKNLTVNSESHYIDHKKPIKFIVHGWQSAGDHDFIQDFAKAYHAIGIHNIFGVDWSPHSMKNYLSSARGTKKVGEIIGQFIMNVIKNDQTLLKNVHVIGFSLGAQASGFAGKQIKNLTRGAGIGRITALDAAGPLFEFPIKLPKKLRVNKDDADYVDSIHTNAGFLGFLASFAHADHYVDYGGPIQPGCIGINIFEAFACSHSKAYNIFNRSILSTEYLSTPCQDPIRDIASLCDQNRKMIMGEHTTPKARGEFFISIDENYVPVNRRGLKKLLDIIPGLG